MKLLAQHNHSMCSQQHATHAVGCFNPPARSWLLNPQQNTLLAPLHNPPHAACAASNNLSTLLAPPPQLLLMPLPSPPLLLHPLLLVLLAPPPPPVVPGNITVLSCCPFINITPPR
jgi:hypothetical protein